MVLLNFVKSESNNNIPLDDLSIDPLTRDKPILTGTADATRKKVIQKIPLIIRRIQSGNPDLLHYSVQDIRKILSDRDPLIDLIIQHGLVQILHGLILTDTRDDTKFEAIWGLTNILSMYLVYIYTNLLIILKKKVGTNEQCRYVVDHGVVPTLIELLASPVDSLREQSCWAISNVVGDTPALRDYVLNLNLTDHLLNTLNAQNLPVAILKNLSWLLSNCIRGNPPPQYHHIEPFIPAICKLIMNTDQIESNTDIINDALWALLHFTDNDTFVKLSKNLICQYDLISTLIKYLFDKTFSKVSIRILGNLLSGEDDIVDIIIGCGFLEHFPEYLRSANGVFVKDCVWSLSNITKTVIKSGILQDLLKLWPTFTRNDVKLEISWVIVNSVGGASHLQTQELIKMDIIRSLYNILELMKVATLKPTSVLPYHYLESVNRLLKIGERLAMQDQSSDPAVPLAGNGREGSTKKKSIFRYVF
ncbi:putative importin subunit alpha C [Tieghemostelium lacteum]|uniref:Importin subunit alpha n=1 Tax=Tieghemostelium lacteum TaxID=361077 RepID=A0A152A1C0_TIELA|nr:putative importin subunit alpha C [Tieghemostelium lacteum]|eukprot:KYR00004.1 putative importin subunit alpha C [Tieghemostelium lacteum]